MWVLCQHRFPITSGGPVVADNNQSGRRLGYKYIFSYLVGRGKSHIESVLVLESEHGSVVFDDADPTGRETERERDSPTPPHSGVLNDPVHALLNVGHLLQHLVDFGFIKLQTNKLRVLRERSNTLLTLLCTELSLHNHKPTHFDRSPFTLIGMRAWATWPLCGGLSPTPRTVPVSISFPDSYEVTDLLYLDNTHTNPLRCASGQWIFQIFPDEWNSNIKLHMNLMR